MFIVTHFCSYKKSFHLFQNCFLSFIVYLLVIIIEYSSILDQFHFINFSSVNQILSLCSQIVNEVKTKSYDSWTPGFLFFVFFLGRMLQQKLCVSERERIMIWSYTCSLLINLSGQRQSPAFSVQFKEVFLSREGEAALHIRTTSLTKSILWTFQ